MAGSEKEKQMDLKILIDDGSPNELKEIKELFTQTVSSIKKDEYNAEQLKVWASSAQNDDEKWLDKIINQYFLVAKMDGKIVGFASLEDNSLVDMLYVHKDFQGKGIAQKLISVLERKAEINHSEKIMSNVSLTARSFFEKNGFTVVKEQKNTINDVPIPNLKMVKKLH